MTFCRLRGDSKTVINFFLLHNFMDRRFVPTVDLSNLSIGFSSLTRWRTSAFSLKGNTFTASPYHIRIASITPCALWGHFLSKTSIIWTGALGHPGHWIRICRTNGILVPRGTPQDITRFRLTIRDGAAV